MNLCNELQTQCLNALLCLMKMGLSPSYNFEAMMETFFFLSKHLSAFEADPYISNTYFAFIQSAIAKLHWEAL